MRLPNEVEPFLDMNEEEERELARATFDMLRSRFITQDQIDFLKRKFWIGRGCFGTSIDEDAMDQWLACVERYNDWSRNPLDLDVLTIGFTRAFEGKQTDQWTSGTMAEAVNRKKFIIDCWYSVWAYHPVRMSAEQYKEWPYPEIKDGRNLMNAQPARIEKAIQTEIAFWKAAQRLFQTGRYPDMAMCIEDVTDSHLTATQVLRSFDRDEWLRRVPEIHEKTQIPSEILRSRVVDFEPSPDYLYLINASSYKEEKKKINEKKYTERVEAYLKRKEKGEDDEDLSYYKRKYGEDYVDEVNF